MTRLISICLALLVACGGGGDPDPTIDAAIPDADLPDAATCPAAPGTCDFFAPCPGVVEICGNGNCGATAECCTCVVDAVSGQPIWQIDYYECAPCDAGP